MNRKAEDMKVRTKKFGLRVINLVESLPRKTIRGHYWRTIAASRNVG